MIEVTEGCDRGHREAFLSVGENRRGYVVGLEAVNCRNGDVIAQDQVTATSKEKVLGALDSAASQLRGELGESLPSLGEFSSF